MRIHHLALRTRNPERLVAFYEGTLGLPVSKRGASTWLDAGGTILMIEHAGANEPEIARDSMELVAFAIAPSDAALVEARLERAGVAVEARTDFTLYVRDPDGRRVGLSAYPEALVVT